MAPPAGGKYTRERLAGVDVYLGVPLGCVLPDARGPLEVLVGTSQESWENSILDIRVLLHGYFLHEYMFFLFRNRPPEELLHQTCRTLRGELDSSTPRASGVFWMVVFDG